MANKLLFVQFFLNLICIEGGKLLDYPSLKKQVSSDYDTSPE